MHTKSGRATKPLDGKWFRQWSLKQILVLVAHLGDDTDDTQHLILVELQEIKWIRVLKIHRTVSLNDTDGQSIADGHATALKFLKESGAQILVWGRILDDGNHKVPELFISAVPDSATGLKHGRYPFDELQHLPPVFWQQLASILDLVVVSQSVRLLSDNNPDMAHALPPSLARVKGLLLDTQREPHPWDKRTRVDVQKALAVALWTQADHQHVRPSGRSCRYVRSHS